MLGILQASHPLGLSDLSWLPFAFIVLNINMGSPDGPILDILVILDNLQDIYYLVMTVGGTGCV